ncbi:MAG: hypothetical protein QG670_1100 [Thermoproteota archaeon]|nr:hypothetical protein [Thermoproteota archaeon]
MEPYVTIIWLNYNSENILNIAKDSLLAIKNLDYSNFELILVDNSSSDNSFREIGEYANSIKLKARILHSSQNLGFAGGNNFAFRHRSPQAKYVALINSDLIPKPDSLTKLVLTMESDGNIGSVQGITFNRNMTEVDSAGDYLDEALRPYLNVDKIPTDLRDITYADGSYCVVRIAALRDIQSDYLFEEELFAYFEDALLGVKLWNNGYTVKVVPTIVGKHLRGGSSRSTFTEIQSIRNRTVAHSVIYTHFGRLYLYRIIMIDLFWSLLRLKRSPSTSSYIKAFVEGSAVGSRLKNKGINLSLYKAPYVKLHTLKILVTPRRRLKISLNDIVTIARQVTRLNR